MDPVTKKSRIGDLPLLEQPQQQLSLTENTTTVQTQQSQPGLQQQLEVAKERPTIWQGILEWHEKQPEGQKISRQVLCHVTANGVNGEAEVKGDVWPQKLVMVLIPKGILVTLSRGFLSDVKRVVFMLEPCQAVQSLSKELEGGFVGCVHFTGTNLNPNCTIKVLILLYCKALDAFFGCIPNDQTGFLDRLRNVVLQQKSLMAANATSPPQTLQNQLGFQQQLNVATERTTIWQGFLGWYEVQKGPPESQKIPRQVPCYVTARLLNGEAEVKGDVWPPKLIMQLIPKEILSTLGRGYLMDSKAVMFMLQPCEALQSLRSAMDNEFVGCVHFTGTNMNPNCRIKVLILLYSKEQNAYIGFIPNDQPSFVDRIREVVRQQRSEQASMRQGQAPSVPMGNTGLGIP